MIGRTLGHYVIGERLGAGGMGEVYRARDTRLERDVALKVLSSDHLQNAPGSSKLRTEALALSRLNHPHIASVYDFDVDGDVAFVVMELVTGADLRDRLRANPLPENEALRIAAQAADALDAAHSAGVIHRDIKPSNLRITPDGRLKVLDFGLATFAVSDRAVDDPTRTAAVTVAGTLPYMSPEQLRAAPPDPRSDIYSLCAVLYEMVSGHRPFAGDTDATLIDRILNAAPEPLDARMGTATVSSGLNAIVQKGLDKDPNRRYQSARELLVDLERLRSPSATRPASLRPATSRWSRLALPVAAVALVAVTGAWFAWRAVRAEPALAFAPREFLLIADFDNQTGESMFDQSLAAALNVGLSQSTYANVVGRARIDQALGRMGRKDSPRIVEALGREICLREGIRGLLAPGISRIGQQYSITARLIDPKTGTAVRSYVQQSNDANAILEALGRIADTVRRDLGESLASISQDSRPLPKVTTASLDALTSYAAGQAEWAKGLYREAVVHFERAIALDNDFAMAHAAMGNALLSFVFNESVRGRQHYERALALSDRITEREQMILKADYEQKLGDRSTAIDLYRAFLFRYPDDATVRYNAAGVLRYLGRYDEAVVEYEHVIRLSPGSAAAFVNLATAHALAGRAPEALAAYDRAFAIEPSWKSRGNLNHEYGFTLAKGNRPAEARQVFALTESAAEERPRGARSQGLLDMYEGHYRSAEKRFTEAVRLDGPLNRPLSEARDRIFLAIVQDALGRRRSAVESLDRAVDQLKSLDGVAFLVRAGVLFARWDERARAQNVLTLARGKTPEEPGMTREIERLEGEIFLVSGRSDAGLDLLRASARQSQQPALVQDSLACAFRRLGRLDEAVAAYRAFVKIDALGWEPQHAWFEALYQLALLEEKRGDRTAALSQVDRLLDLWRDGDTDLPLLAAARGLRARLQTIGSGDRD